MFPSVNVQVRQQGAWKLHPHNSDTQKLFFTCQIWHKFQNFEVTIVFSYLVSLVISTISMVKTVSSQASKHFFSFAHCPHHTRSVSIVAYQSNIHCPHLSKPKVCVTYSTSFWMVVMPRSLHMDPLAP